MSQESTDGIVVALQNCVVEENCVYILLHTQLWTVFHLVLVAVNLSSSVCFVTTLLHIVVHFLEVLGSALACCRILSVGRKQKRFESKTAIQNMSQILIFNLIAGVILCSNGVVFAMFIRTFIRKPNFSDNSRVLE